ncbi:THUMP domain-containing protein 1 [Plakobranchus ocellatus]|uniref:THUMP domain-containing protein 1 n=1 Tax=Plakobranchus ocellatus TaxID=259542 RepID=A0AAV4CK13_9GAST|nr:THUMP domain-containing protein 1 [Plakobranchus ocellatus]
MPLEFIHLDKGSQFLGPEDRGFLINLTKARWSDNACSEAIKLLRNFTQLYYTLKCPESKAGEKASGNTDLDELEGDESYQAPSKEDKSGIQFAIREMVYPNVGFVACNLADPSDFAHFVLSKLADRKDYKKPRLPFRILPVQRICEAKAKSVEHCVKPILESTLAKDEFPYRFSLIFRGHSGGEYLSNNEAKSVVRNCVWALNPNCVQCIKYQDYAVIMDVFDPLFVVGVAKDFQKLASYNTWIIRHGVKTDLGTDSEDDISDDPTLSEEEERKRKLRIKRKRRAEKAGLAQREGEVKRSVEELEKCGERDGEGEEDEPGLNGKKTDDFGALNGEEDEDVDSDNE